MKKPDVILVGDIHARDDQPLCRVDDFWETQKQKFLWLKDLWKEYDYPIVLQPGDLFHRWKSSPRVINVVLECLPPMITIPGNPGKHNQFGDRDALYTVSLASKGWDVLFERLTIIPSHRYIVPCLWGNEPDPEAAPKGCSRILLTHRMILDGPAPFDGDNGLDFLKKHSEYGLIVSGHNHKPMVFVTGTPRNPRRLVNPGSFTRQTASETHRPRVYLWWSKDNRMEPVYIPIREEDVVRDHIEEHDKRENRLAAFVESLAKEDRGVSTSFKDNMDVRLASEDIREPVKQRVREAMDVN